MVSKHNQQNIGAEEHEIRSDEEVNSVHMSFFEGVIDGFIEGGALGMISVAVIMVISKACGNSNQSVSKTEESRKENSTETIEQIRKLAELNKQGILSDEEFESKKRELLEKV